MAEQADTDAKQVVHGSEEDKSAFFSFVKGLASATGDLSQLTCPAPLLNGLSLLDYSTHWGSSPKLFKAIVAAKTHESRIKAVTEYFISTLYASYHERCKNGTEKKPFNPVLGETMHVTWEGEEDTVIDVEQVCHHPPITAFHLENKKAGICLNGQCGQKTKFKSAAIAVQQTGRARIDIPALKETYVISYPELYVRGLLTGSIFLELTGTTRIDSNTGYVSEVEFVPKPWIGGEYHTIKGSVTAPDGKAVAHMLGKWTDVTHWSTPQEPKVGKEILFSVPDSPAAKRIFTPEDQQKELDSHKLWGKASQYLKSGNYKEATREKSAIEEGQRKLRKDREAAGEQWMPAMFRIETDEETATNLTGVIEKKGKKDGPEWNDWVAKESMHLKK